MNQPRKIYDYRTASAVCSNCWKGFMVRRDKAGTARFCSVSCFTDIIHRIDRSNPSGCWPWLGSKAWTPSTKSYYGKFRRCSDNKSMSAAKAVYERLVGPVPEGLELDHLCRNTVCVKPSHLEPVTRMINIGRQPKVIERRKSLVCAHGHLWSEHGEIIKNGTRRCRTCARIAKARFEERRKAR